MIIVSSVLATSRKKLTRTRENIIPGVAGSCCFGQKLETQENLGVEKLGTYGNCMGTVAMLQ